MVASCVAGVEVTEVTVGEGIGRGSGNEWLGDERLPIQFLKRGCATIGTPSLLLLLCLAAAATRKC